MVVPALASSVPGSETRTDRIGGWEVRSTTGPIAGSAECDTVSARLGLACPTMLFGSSSLHLSRVSSAVAPAGTAAGVHFSACEALTGVGGFDGSIRVAAAVRGAWASRREELGVGPYADRDWTYTTNYGGKVEGLQVCGRREGRSGLLDDPSLRDCSIPIRFYADVPLFEDELDDNGVASYRVRIVRNCTHRREHAMLENELLTTNLKHEQRCMPDVLLILARFFLRVDGVLYRVRDTRYIHRYDSDKLVCEQSWHDCSWDNLPDGVSSNNNADVIASKLPAQKVTTTMYAIPK